MALEELMETNRKLHESLNKCSWQTAEGIEMRHHLGMRIESVQHYIELEMGRKDFERGKEQL